MTRIHHALRAAAGNAIPDDAHEYWRIYITANNGGAYMSCGEIEMREEAGGQNLCTGGTPSASEEYPGDWGADNAFDGLNGANHEWSDDGGGPPQWIAYQFSSAVSVRHLTLISAESVSSMNQMIRDFELQYSDDGTNWTTAGSWSGETGWSKSEVRSYSV